MKKDDPSADQTGKPTAKNHDENQQHSALPILIVFITLIVIVILYGALSD